MKYLILVIIGLFLIGCDEKSGGNQAEVQKAYSCIQEIMQAQTPSEAAVLAYKKQVECGLTEDQMIALIEEMEK